jgi:hypothetical protein
MYSDSLGAATNATSGVAISTRAKLGVTNQRVGLDHLELMLKREGRMLLNLMQGGSDENVLVNILTPDEEESIILNLSRTINGKKVIFNDVRTLPVGVYAEPTHDYESLPEEQRETFKAIMDSPNAQLYLQSPGFLKILGLRDWQKISTEMQSIMTQQMQMQQQMASGVPIQKQEAIDQSPTAGLMQ